MNRKEAQTQMMYELERLQNELSCAWLDKSMPKDWNGQEAQEPIARPKTRVTVRLDSDMVRWFRKLGPGYGARLNSVLRVYWLALMSGQIKGYPNDDTTPRIQLAAQEIIDRYKHLPRR